MMDDVNPGAVIGDAANFGLWFLNRYDDELQRIEGNLPHDVATTSEAVLRQLGDTLDTMVDRWLAEELDRFEELHADCPEDANCRELLDRKHDWLNSDHGRDIFLQNLERMFAQMDSEDFLLVSPMVTKESSWYLRAVFTIGQTWQIAHERGKAWLEARMGGLLGGMLPPGLLEQLMQRASEPDDEDEAPPDLFGSLGL